MLSKLSQWLMAAALVFSVSASAQAETYKAGVHYRVLAEPVPVMADGKVHVEEAFWYGCPHCFTLESTLKPWKEQLPSDVQFSGVPAMFGRAWVAHAQLYHVADALGVLDKVNMDIFNAVNIERSPLLTRKDQRDFLIAKAGVDGDDFDKAYESFTVKSRMRQSEQRINAFQISGVPAIIVQGKYVVDSSTAGSPQDIVKVVNELIAKERQALGR